MRQPWLASSTTAGQKPCVPAPRRLSTGVKPWWTLHAMWVVALLQARAVAGSLREMEAFFDSLKRSKKIPLSGGSQEESHAAGLWKTQQTDGRGSGRKRCVYTVAMEFPDFSMCHWSTGRALFLGTGYIMMFNVEYRCFVIPSHLQVLTDTFLAFI